MKKPRWFNPQDFADMIERFNPFGFKKSNGESLIFETYLGVYKYTLDKLTAMFPRGYVDLVLFLHEMTGMPANDCKQIVKSWKSLGVEETMLIEFWSASPDRSIQLKRIMQALHSLSGTHFNEAYFSEAMRELDTEKLKRRLEYGTSERK